MKTVLVLLALNCPKTHVHFDAWNGTDMKQLVASSARCQIKYQASPCLKWFKKLRPQSYQAVCEQEMQYATE
jgi:hypothetical protein